MIHRGGFNRLYDKKRSMAVIHLTRLNNEDFVINCKQIERIESIPESNIVLVSGKHYVVKESVEEIIDRVIEFHAEIQARVQKKNG
ncbi:MAG: flagellar FlbD family protein [Lacrimispora sp.]|uniref:flagellar FlbD family protein n=1 Tax=Lacrimispora sp. TaxID=2719234 RepID=UPI0039E66863